MSRSSCQAKALTTRPAGRSLAVMDLGGAHTSSTTSYFKTKTKSIFRFRVEIVGWSMKFRETKFREISRKNSFRISQNFYVYFAKFRLFREILWNFCHEILFPAWQGTKTMLRWWSKKHHHYFRHPFLHNEIVAPQVSMGEHSIHITSNFNVLKRHWKDKFRFQLIKFWKKTVP
jgi:hypothetical protein